MFYKWSNAIFTLLIFFMSVFSLLAGLIMFGVESPVWNSFFTALAFSSIFTFFLYKAPFIKRAWHKRVLFIGIFVALTGSMVLHSLIPDLQKNLELNREPIVLNVSDLTNRNFNQPTFVILTGFFDESLAKRLSSHSTYRDHKGHTKENITYYCRTPLLRQKNDPDKDKPLVMTNHCAIYSGAPSNNEVSLYGLLTRESDRYFLDTDISWEKNVAMSGVFFAFYVLVAGLAVLFVAIMFGTPQEKQIRKPFSWAQTFAFLKRNNSYSYEAQNSEVHFDKSVSTSNNSGSTLETSIYVPRVYDRLSEALKNAKAITHLDLVADWDQKRPQTEPLTELPVWISQFTNLKTLDLLWNNITFLPTELGELTNLEDIVLNYNPISESSIQVLHLLSHLRNLQLDSCRLKGIPISKSWQKLTHLGLEHNQLKALPEAITKLSALKNLNVSHNELQELPKNWDGVKNLQILRLNNNKLTKIPQGFLDLENLTILNLDHNLITELPQASESNLLKLEELSLLSNKIQEWPLWIWKLPKVKKLFLFNDKFNAPEFNCISVIPEEVYELANLEELTLTLAPNATVSPHFEKLTQLKRLTLAASDFPEAMGESYRLEELRFIRRWQKKNTSPLNQALGGLKNLKTLVLDLDSAAQVPDAISECRSLKNFTLECDRINDHQKQRLRTLLRTSGCKITIKLAAAGREIVL